MVLRYPSRLLALVGLLGALAAGLPVRPAGALDAVVNMPCTDTEFSAALTQVQGSGGGTITFNCGGPVVIEFDSEKTITGSVRIEGNGEITLSGDEDVRLFSVEESATLELDGLVLVLGSAENGGAIYNDGGIVAISNSDFFDNFTEVDGGAIYNDGGDVTISNGEFDDNDAQRDGGAIYNLGGTVSISDSFFQGGDADDAGAIYNGEDSILTISSTGFDSNEAEDDGGAILNLGELTIDSSDFYSNTANDGTGGAIDDDGGSAITITSTRFEENHAGDQGGAIDSEASILTIIDSSFVGNSTELEDGGAIWTSSETTIRGSNFESNGAGDDGGAIVADEVDLTVERTTFHGNSAAESGGAVYTTGNEGQTALLTIDRSTFSGNNAAFEGGAIFANEFATVDIANTTIYDNEASAGGGGLYYNLATVALFNTIVANNLNGDCAGEDVTSNGHNLDSDGTCNLDQPTGLPATDPMLADLGNYGGETPTHLPLDGSPVIDKGPAICTNPDQRGQPAPLGTACDIGAVERGAVPDTLQGSSDSMICVYRVNRQVFYPKASGDCGSRQLYPFDIADNLLFTLCINRLNGIVTLAQDGCPRGSEPHFIPDDFSLLTCTDRATGVVRGLTANPCSRYEIPGAIAVEFEPVQG